MQRIDCGGKFTYVFTPYAQPIAEVEDGETFEVVTEDAFVGALNSEEQNPRSNRSFFQPPNGTNFRTKYSARRYGEDQHLKH